MIVLKDKYKGNSIENLSQEYRELLKEQNLEVFNLFFTEQ